MTNEKESLREHISKCENLPLEEVEKWSGEELSAWVKSKIKKNE